MGIKNYLAAVCLIFLTACGGIESTEIPTDEHSLNYHIEFEKKIEKELPLSDLKTLKRFMRRVGQKNVEAGTDIGDALKLQKKYEVEAEKKRLAEIKENRLQQIKEYKAALIKFKKEVGESKSLFNFKSQSEFDKYISDNIQVTLYPENLRKKYCYKCYKYSVEFEAKVVDDLGVSALDIEYINKLKDPSKKYEGRWDLSHFNKSEDGEKKIYTKKKALFEVKTSNELTLDDIKKKNDMNVSIKKVYIGGNLFKDPDEFTMQSVQSYLDRLDSRIKRIEDGIQEVEADEGKLFKHDFNKNFTRNWRDS